MRCALMLFVKEPAPGRVKTRLAREIGDELAAAFYRALVEHVLRATRDDGVERLVFVDGDVDVVRAWLPGETCLPQDGADLGARMANAFDAAFARGAERVAVAGSDVPGLDAARVGAALNALGSADVAIAPAGDGGYSLLALRAPQPALFTGIAWSTPEVLERTLRAAGGLRVEMLAELPDLDTPDDLRRQAPALAAWLPSGLAAALASRRLL